MWHAQTNEPPDISPARSPARQVLAKQQELNDERFANATERADNQARAGIGLHVIQQVR